MDEKPAISKGPRTPRVLLADDSRTNQQIVTFLLERLGCQVDIAADGREALALSQSTEYDIIFMDCHMPVMDGFQATTVIRALTAYRKRHLPIIALSTTATARERQRCFEVGMDDFLSKPPELTELETTLFRWVESPDKPEVAAASFGIPEPSAVEADAARIRHLAQTAGPRFVEDLRQVLLTDRDPDVGASRMAAACLALEVLGKGGAPGDAPLLGRLRQEFGDDRQKVGS